MTSALSTNTKGKQKSEIDEASNVEVNFEEDGGDENGVSETNKRATFFVCVWGIGLVLRQGMGSYRGDGDVDVDDHCQQT
jgi:hypothetical protein